MNEGNHHLRGGLREWRARLSSYHFAAVGVFLLALLLTLLVPYEQGGLRMPEPWSYELAAEKFAQGEWVLSTEELAAARTSIRLRGGQLTQYVEVAPDQWAFRQSPGHPLTLALFGKVGWPRLANISLAALAVLVLFPLLAAHYSEKIALLGVTLLLWSPLSLLALHYYQMDTFAGGMWPLIAGGLLLWYEAGIGWKRYAHLFLFGSGVATGWSVAVRQTSGLLAVVLVGFLLWLLFARRNQPTSVTTDLPTTWYSKKWIHLAAFGLGILLAASILLVYNQLTFGRPFTTGYLFPSPYNQHNLWSDNPVTAVPGGVETWLAGGTVGDIFMTLLVHLRLWLRPATFAWPLWPLALLGLVQLCRQRPVKRPTWLMLFWLLAIYLPFAGVIFFGVTRALAEPYDQGWGYFIPARYLYPLMLPFVWALAYLLSRWPGRWSYLLVGFYALGSAGLFLATLSH